MFLKLLHFLHIHAGYLAFFYTISIYAMHADSCVVSFIAHQATEPAEHVACDVALLAYASVARQPLVGQRLPIIEVSRSQTHHTR
jgi:hypothetical protein